MPSIVSQQQHRREPGHHQHTQGVLVAGQEDEEGRGETRVQRDASEQGGRLQVKVAAAGVGHHPGPARQQDHQGHGKGADRERDDHRQQTGPQAHAEVAG